VTGEPRLAGVAALVTGGAGFIGSHLVDALVARGARVRVLDDLSSGRRANLEGRSGGVDFVEADLRDREACRRACQGVNLVFHLAALGSVPRSLADPGTTLDVNVGGTARLLTAARDAGVGRVVYASSSSVYGDSAALPKREGEEGRPLSPYAVSKRMNEELAQVFESCFGMELVGLRYFNVYGPRQSPDGPYAAVIPRFFSAAARGEAPTVYGDGEQSRDFTFVADAVQATLLAAGAPAAACGRAFNVGGGTAVTVNRLAALVRDLAGGGPEPRREPARAGDVRASLADLAAVRRDLGFEPAWDLARGLAATAPWFLAAERAGAPAPVR
jgi:nucleoside-diphosphate-sugar epimerase